MIVDLTTWIEKQDYDAGILKSAAKYLLLKDSLHFYLFYGHVSSIGIFRRKISQSKEDIGRAIIPIECENPISFCKTEEDVETTSFFNARYSSKEARSAIISSFEHLLLSSEVEKYKRNKLELSNALMTDSEARFECVRKKFPNMSLFVINYLNTSIDDGLNSVAVILNPKSILLDEVYISGFGEVHKKKLNFEM